MPADGEAALSCAPEIERVFPPQQSANGRGMHPTTRSHDGCSSPLCLLLLLCTHTIYSVRTVYLHNTSIVVGIQQVATSYETRLLAYPSRDPS